MQPLLGYREWAIIPLLVLVCAAFAAGRPHLFAAFAVLLAAVTGYSALRKAVAQMVRAGRSVRVAPSLNHGRNTFRLRVSDLRADAVIALFRPVLRLGALRQAQDYAEDRIKSYILRSGSAQNPRLLGIKSVLYPVVAGVIAVPASIAVLVMHGPGAAAAVPFVPALLMCLFYFVTLRIKADDRRTAIEEEIAPFATLASIMESVNVSLFSTLRMVARSPADVFPVMKQEGARIRNLTDLGKSPIAALMDLADSHPSTAFRNFLDGYVSSFNTGGTDTAAYLQEQARRFFRQMRSGMDRYARQADMIAQVILTVMLLVPMMGLSMMFFATGQTATTMMVLLTVMFPPMTAVLVSIVHARQPRNRNVIRTHWSVLAAGAAAAGVVHLAGAGQLWEAIGAGVVTGSFLNMLFVKKAFAESASVEGRLPEFMRQVTRFKNIGVDIMGAIRHMRHEIVRSRGSSGSPSTLSSTSSHGFGRTFDDIIDRLYMAMAAGGTLEQAVSRVSIRSWNARLVFFILGKVHESGGGTAKTLDDITRWVTEYHDAKKEMVANLRSSLLTAFVGPVLMVMIHAMSRQLSLRFEESYNAVAGRANIINIVPPADASGLSEVLTITATACMGVALSKINYFTVRHTMFTGVITLVTMALLYAVPYLPAFEI